MHDPLLLSLPLTVLVKHTLTLKRLSTRQSMVHVVYLARNITLQLAQRDKATSFGSPFAWFREGVVGKVTAPEFNAEPLRTRTEVVHEFESCLDRVRRGEVNQAVSPVWPGHRVPTRDRLTHLVHSLISRMSRASRPSLPCSSVCERGARHRSRCARTVPSWANDSPCPNSQEGRQLQEAIVTAQSRLRRSSTACTVKEESVRPFLLPHSSVRHNPEPLTGLDSVSLPGGCRACALQAPLVASAPGQERPARACLSFAWLRDPRIIASHWADLRHHQDPIKLALTELRKRRRSPTEREELVRRAPPSLPPRRHPDPSLTLPSQAAIIAAVNGVRSQIQAEESPSSLSVHAEPHRPSHTVTECRLQSLGHGHGEVARGGLTARQRAVYGRAGTRM